MNRPVAMVYSVVMMSHEVVQQASLPQADILKSYVEKAIAGLPDTIYAIERRIVRCGVRGPWDLWDIAKGGDHMDPLAQDRYSLRLYSYNLYSLSQPERAFAQGIANNIPEGSLLPPEFAAYLESDRLTRKGDLARSILGLPPQPDPWAKLNQSIVQHQAGLISQKTVTEILLGMKEDDK